MAARIVADLDHTFTAAVVGTAVFTREATIAMEAIAV
jgi:hypothetical protein